MGGESGGGDGREGEMMSPAVLVYSELPAVERHHALFERELASPGLHGPLAFPQSRS